MSEKFNYYIVNPTIIVNSKTGKSKLFKTRSEFIEFLEQEVELNEKTLIQFKKDIKCLTKEMLLLKYLPNYYIRKE